jgi:hypothetical protein
MSDFISIEKAQGQLRSLIEGLSLGQTITLVDSDGVPIAVLIGLEHSRAHQPSSFDRLTQLEASSRATDES